MAKIKILFKELWALLKINSVEAMFCVYNAKKYVVIVAIVIQKMDVENFQTGNFNKNIIVIIVNAILIIIK